jgi:hypothetical protein
MAPANDAQPVVPATGFKLASFVAAIFAARDELTLAARID